MRYRQKADTDRLQFLFKKHRAQRPRLAAALLVGVAFAGSGTVARGQGSPQSPAQHVAPATPAQFGAADLIAALTAPDRVAEIAALRDIREVLARAPDPAALATARTQLNALLEMEERRQPEIPPTLVMNTLAGRIDAAIANLERARPAPHDSVLAALTSGTLRLPGGLDWTLPATLALLAMSAGAGFAAGRTGPRHLSNNLDAALNGMLQAGARLDNASRTIARTQERATSANDAAQDARSAAEVAISAFERASQHAEKRLLACLEAADTHQEKAAALATYCDTLGRDLPEALAGAVDAVETRAMASIESAAGDLAASARAITAAAATLPAAATTIEIGAADALKAGSAQIAALTDACARTDAIVGMFPDIAAQLAASVASLNRELAARREAQAALDSETAHRSAASAERTDASDGDARPTPAAAENAAAAEHAEAMAASLARAEGIVRMLPEIAASLAAATADARRESNQAAQMLDLAAADIARAATAATTAGGVALACLTRLEAASDSNAQAAASLAASAAALPQTTHTLQTAAEAGSATLANAALQVRAAIATLAAEQVNQHAVLESWRSQADAALTALPLEAGQLAASACAMREDAAALQAAAWRMEAGRQDPGAIDELLSGPLTALGEVCTRLGDGAARLDGATGTLTQDAANLVHAARQCADDTRAASANLSHQAMAVVSALAQAASDRPQDDSTRHDLARLTVDLITQTDRMECVLARGERLTGELGMAAEQVRTLASSVVNTQQMNAADAHLAQLAAVAAQVEAAIGRLAARTELYEAASDRVAQAALGVAIAAGQAQAAPSLARLTGLAGETRALQKAAGVMAETALRGETSLLPQEVVSDMPALLAAIETSIQELHGTATALAVASDAARLAA